MNTIDQAWPVPGGRLVVKVETSTPLTSEQVSYMEVLIEAVESFVGSFPTPERTEK